jgi:hypothetical protein
MAKARTAGSGWHKQSVRHSNARKFGKAGGKYASIEGKDFWKDLNDKQRAVIRGNPLYFADMNNKVRRITDPRTILKYKGDYDADGVKDAKDCKPLDPTRQGKTHDKEKSQQLRTTLKRLGWGVGTLGTSEFIGFIARHPQGKTLRLEDFSDKDLRQIRREYTPLQQELLFGLKEKDFKARGIK